MFTERRLIVINRMIPSIVFFVISQQITPAQGLLLFYNHSTLANVIIVHFVLPFVEGIRL